MKKVFITFGGGGQNFIDAGNRIIDQVQRLKLFDVLKLYTAEDLKQDEEFWNKHTKFIESNKRGYGYYVWKPYIFQKTMSKMKDGDILLYLDAGCEVMQKNGSKLPKFFKQVKKDLLIGSYDRHNYNEKSWTKMDIFKFMKMKDKKYMDTRQRQSGLVMISVCDKTRKLIDEWCSITSNNYHLIDDSPSKSKNVSSFKENRHDQSIFSLLTKKHRLYSEFNLSQCVEMAKNRSGRSKSRYRD